MHQDWLQTENGYKSLIVLGGVFFVGLLCVSAVLLYAAYEGIIDGGTASLGASLLLVVLTGAYAFLTLWMSYETKRSRQQAIKPVVEFRPREYRSTIVNLSNGPARNINLTLTLEPKGKSHHVHWHSLVPQQEIAITADPFSTIADREYLDLQFQGADIDLKAIEDDDKFWEEFDEHPYEQLHITGTCEDAWGNILDIDEQYDVWDLTETMVGTVPSSMDEKSSIELIAVELSSMRGLIEDLVGASDDGVQSLHEQFDFTEHKFTGGDDSTEKADDRDEEL